MTGFKDAHGPLVPVLKSSSAHIKNFAGIPCVSNKTLTQQAFLLKKQSNASHISKLLKPNIS